MFGETSCIIWSEPSMGATSQKTSAITKLESQLQSPSFLKLKIHGQDAEKKIQVNKGECEET